MAVATTDTTTRPEPRDATERARWREAHRRERLVTGRWGEDLRRRVLERVGSQRAAVIFGASGLGPMAAAEIARVLAVLYDREPAVTHPALDPDAPTMRIFRDQLRAAGLWACQRPLLERVLVAREWCVHVGSRASGALVLRPASPGSVVVGWDPAMSREPLTLVELRWRKVAGRARWVWEVWDLDAPAFEAPSLRAYLPGEASRGAPGSDLVALGDDVSDEVFGGPILGDRWEWRRADGSPYLPWVVYHAEPMADAFWHPWGWAEIVDRSLDLAVLWAYLQHCLLDASHPQRVILDGLPAGLAEGDVAREVVTDPATVLIVEAMGEDAARTPRIDQWQPAADPESLHRVWSRQYAELAQSAGVVPSDVQRLSDVARSGTAIALSQEGQRRAQRQLAPLIRPADERLVRLCAREVRRRRGVDLPESGWRVRYRETPMGGTELQQLAQTVAALVDAGLISPVEAWLYLHPGASEDEARAAMASRTLTRLTR